MSAWRGTFEPCGGFGHDDGYSTVVCLPCEIDRITSERDLYRQMLAAIALRHDESAAVARDFLRPGEDE